MRKTLFCVLMTTLLLAGCAAGEGREDWTAEELALQIRTEYLAAPGCAGTAAVTADYGQRVYEFQLEFSWRREGETVLTITAPEELAGLTARVAEGEGRLEFQGVSLGTGDLTGEGLTPLEYLPAVMEQIDEGYMAVCALETLGETEALRVVFREAELGPEEGLEYFLWFSRTEHSLLRAELYQEGCLVLQSEFETFTLGENTDATGTDEDLGGDQPGQSGT